CQPSTQASTKTVRCSMSAGGPKAAAAPSAIAAIAPNHFPLPPPGAGVGCTVALGSSTLCLPVGPPARGGGGLGGGHLSAPSCSTSTPRWTSSSSLSATFPSGATSLRRLNTVVA